MRERKETRREKWIESALYVRVGKDYFLRRKDR